MKALKYISLIIFIIGIVCIIASILLALAYPTSGWGVMVPLVIGVGVLIVGLLGLIIYFIEK